MDNAGGLGCIIKNTLPACSLAGNLDHFIRGRFHLSRKRVKGRLPFSDGHQILQRKDSLAKQGQIPPVKNRTTILAACAASLTSLLKLHWVMIIDYSWIFPTGCFIL
jgi:hypothetical protein